MQMIKATKTQILKTLDRLGYRVLTRAAHEELMMVAADRAAPTPTGRPQLPTLEPGVGDIPPGESDFGRFFSAVREGCELPAPRLLAIYSAVQYIVRAQVPGDFVDCGLGATQTLRAIAAALLHFGQSTQRRLVILDTTADPLHRAETELAPWGVYLDLLSPPYPKPRHATSEPTPPEILSLGYPERLISVRRYPRDPIVQDDPVAFAGLLSETYESNRLAVAAILPRISRGGVIALEGKAFPRMRGGMEGLLRELGQDLFLVPVDANYRMGIIGKNG
jgi:O-methyltransferase